MLRRSQTAVRRRAGANRPSDQYLNSAPRPDEPRRFHAVNAVNDVGVLKVNVIVGLDILQEGVKGFLDSGRPGTRGGK